jgi:outer membrane protein TolC
MPDLRFGVGYNFTRTNEPAGALTGLQPARRGFYFTISSKLSNLFDLFGTRRAGLQGAEDAGQRQKEEEKH